MAEKCRRFRRMSLSNNMVERPSSEVEIPGVGRVMVPNDPMPDDFPNLYMTKEEICFRLFDLERRIRDIERTLAGLDN